MLDKMNTKLLTSWCCMFAEASRILLALLSRVAGCFFFFFTSFFLAFSSELEETSIAEDISWMRFARRSGPGVATSAAKPLGGNSIATFLLEF